MSTDSEKKPFFEFYKIRSFDISYYKKFLHHNHKVLLQYQDFLQRNPRYFTAGNCYIAIFILNLTMLIYIFFKNFTSCQTLLYIRNKTNLFFYLTKNMIGNAESLEYA